MIPGIILILGPSYTVQFCFQKQKIAGFICFILGVIMVISGWAFFGFIVEVFGFINLFGNFFPAAYSFAKTLIWASWGLIYTTGVSSQ